MNYDKKYGEAFLKMIQNLKWDVPENELYHTTNLENISKINEKGIIPKIGYDTKQFVRDVKNPNPVAFFSDRPYEQSKTLRSDPIIYKIDPEEYHKIYKQTLGGGKNIVTSKNDLNSSMVPSLGDYYSNESVTPKTLIHPSSGDPISEDELKKFHNYVQDDYKNIINDFKDKDDLNRLSNNTLHITGNKEDRISEIEKKLSDRGYTEKIASPKYRESKIPYYLKNPKTNIILRTLPWLGGGLAAYSALRSGDAAAAGMDYVIPGGVENVGEGSDEVPQMSKEQASQFTNNPNLFPELRKRFELPSAKIDQTYQEAEMLPHQNSYLEELKKRFKE